MKQIYIFCSKRMAQNLPYEILEQIFLHLRWKDLRSCKDVCHRWKELIITRIEDKIEQKWNNRGPRMEIRWVFQPLFSPDTRVLFSGSGALLISEMHTTHVNVYEGNIYWILKVNEQAEIVSGQATEDIIVIETSLNEDTNNTLEIWNRISRTLITEIELEDDKRAGAYKCYESNVLICNKTKAQFTSISVRNGEKMEKIVYRAIFVSRADVSQSEPGFVKSELKPFGCIQTSLYKYEAETFPIDSKTVTKNSFPPEDLQIVDFSPSLAVVMYSSETIYKKKSKNTYKTLSFLEIKKNEKIMAETKCQIIQARLIKVKIIDNFTIVIFKEKSNTLKMNIYSVIIDRKLDELCPSQRLGYLDTMSYTNPEYCHLDYQDGNLVVMLDPSQIFLFDLDSYYDGFHGKGDFKKNFKKRMINFVNFRELIPEGHYHNSHMSVDKTTISVHNFPLVHQILSRKNTISFDPSLPIVSARLNFWI